jgi:hypothetical protein
MRMSPLLLLLLMSPPMRAADHLFPIHEGRKAGYIDRSGVVVVPATYDAVGECREGRARVTAGSLSGYIDLNGKVVIEPKYESAGDFRDGRAIVRTADRYSLIDLSGKVIAEIPYRVLGEFHQGMLRVQAAGKTDESGRRRPTMYGFADRDGKMVIPPQFVSASEFPEDPADLPFGSLDRDWCYFDRAGHAVIRISMGPQLRGADPFSSGRLRVKEGFTWGYKDASGNWAIQPTYNDATDFSGGIARVQQGEKWIFIDLRGKEVAQESLRLRPVQPYSDGLALVRQGDLSGWVDRDGKLAFPLRKYEQAYKFSSGLARIRVDGMWGFIDRTGNLALPAQYYGASDFDHGLAWVQTREGTAYIDAKGKAVWQSAPRR